MVSVFVKEMHISSDSSNINCLVTCPNCVTLLNTTHHLSARSSDLRRQLAVPTVAGWIPAEDIYFHFDFSLVSRSSQLDGTRSDTI